MMQACLQIMAPGDRPSSSAEREMESDEPEAMMQACLQIMAPGDRPSSSAEREMESGS